MLPGNLELAREWQRTPTGSGAVGITTAYQYDAWGRLSLIGYPAASALASATPDVSFTYDSAGRVLTRTVGALSPSGRRLYSPNMFIIRGIRDIRGLVSRSEREEGVDESGGAEARSKDFSNMKIITEIF